MSPSELKISTTHPSPGILFVQLDGRMDTFGSRIVAEGLEKALDPSVLALAIDMEKVSYLSSGGLRVFSMNLKKLKGNGGAFLLFNLTEYCRDVLDISGMSSFFPILSSYEEALDFSENILRERLVLSTWERLEVLDLEKATIRVIPGSEHARGVVELLGDVKEVLHADITESQVASKTFSETEYSIGCGALGDELDDYFPIMGEMITIGGTMVWLPTDGHDTPDFLIPRKSSRAITIRTVFNACLEGGFNEYFLLSSKDAAGIPIDELYRLIFDTAKTRRPDYRGVIGIAARAEFSAVFGSGISKSPVRQFKPANGETIVHPSNIGEWFAGDREPRLTDVTGLMCGVGVDLTSDLSAFDSKYVDQAFYRHPDNTGGKSHLLHNHAVFFSPQPMAERCVNLETEIQKVVETGDFRDMRHLLDQSRITRALIGVSYIQEIRPESE